MPVLTYILEKGKKPLYEELYENIRADILSGVLAEGSKLPSKRALADHLQISKVTVEKAYAQLQVEGYVYSRQRQGYFVDRVERQRELPKPHRPAAGEEPRANLIADFAGNSADESAFPFSVWARLTRRTLLEHPHELVRAMRFNGAPELRQAISEYLYRFRGIDAPPENIIVGAGTEYLYGLVILLLGMERHYACEDPCHKKLADIYTAYGVPFTPVPVDGSGIVPEELERSGAEVVHLSPAHHFPTGVVTPVGRRQELLNWASAGNRYIIEDDYDSEFRYSGRPIPPLLRMDRVERVIYMNTFSKSISPSIRISYMVLPPRLVRQFTQKLGFYSCTVPAAEQYTLAAFIREGYFEKHISRMRKRYGGYRDYLIECLKKSRFAGRIAIREEDAGLHFLLQLDTQVPDEEICRRCLALGIRVRSLGQYCIRASAEPHIFVINYSGVRPETAEKAIKTLETFFDS